MSGDRIGFPSGHVRPGRVARGARGAQVQRVVGSTVFVRLNMVDGVGGPGASGESNPALVAVSCEDLEPDAAPPCTILGFRHRDVFGWPILRRCYANFKMAASPCASRSACSISWRPSKNA